MLHKYLRHNLMCKLLFQNLSEIHTIIKERTTRSIGLGLMVQPLMFVLRDCQSYQYYVVADGLQYKLATSLKCLYICILVHQIFNLKYAYTFLQRTMYAYTLLTHSYKGPCMVSLQSLTTVIL